MSPGRSPLNILLSSDERGVLGLAAAGRSIAEHAPPSRDIRFHLFHSGLDNDTLHKLEDSWTCPGRQTSLVPLEFSVGRVKDLMRSRDVPHMSYSRIFLDEILQDDVARCVYCDIDVLFERDVSELHDMDLEGATIAAVSNATEEDGEAQFRRLGVPGRHYFNAGILAIDVNLWRRQEVSTRALGFCRTAGEALVMHDQDALNVILRDSWKPLPDYWNWWRPEAYTGTEAAIIHMAMNPKPWHPDYQGIHRERFFHYLDRTAFAGTRPKELTALGHFMRRMGRWVPYWPTVLRRLRRSVGGLIGKSNST
jgi:lipopolysaccharide biosynthesis glycosyltransferase